MEETTHYVMQQCKYKKLILQTNPVANNKNLHKGPLLLLLLLLFKK